MFKILPLLLLIVSFGTFAKEDHATLGIDFMEKEGGKLLALTIKHEPHWHTYWKNPGDAGITTVFKFESQGKTIELEGLEWPLPDRHVEGGDILTYGYEGEPTFFFKLPTTLKTPFKVKTQWLICKDICIPGGAEAEIDPSKKGLLSSTELTQRLESLPTPHPWPEELEFYLSRTGEKTLRIDYTAKNRDRTDINTARNLLTPFLAPPMGFKAEEVRFDSNDHALVGRTLLEWDGEYQDPPRPLPKNSVFNPPLKLRFLYQAPAGKTWVLEREVTRFSPTAKGLEEHFQKYAPLSGQTDEAQKKNDSNLLLMLVLAFLGGLILNLMPCVLPVISIKLFGLIKHRDLPRARLLRHNLSYSAGVMLTFMLLALTVVLIKASGEAVGWGFQLQSAPFVLAMVLVLFVLALNMFGLFEFVTPGGRSLGNAKTEDGIFGDFFSGVLSTILSTPCSAPFLGTALTFAFTGGTSMVFLIFASVGLGLASPFILTGLFPATVHLLPKPGVWMEKLKYFLGLTLLITVVWLGDVFLNLVDGSLWIWPLGLILVMVFFAFFFRAKVSRHFLWNALFFALPAALLISALSKMPLAPVDRSNIKMVDSAWRPWSESTLQGLKGQWVFMDFTAAWCLTCKVNKKLVLDTDSFRSFVAKENLTLVRGDWTQRDDAIAHFLEKHGAVGVPAYFVQKPDGEIVALGETISIGKIQAIIER